MNESERKIERKNKIKSAWQQTEPCFNPSSCRVMWFENQSNWTLDDIICRCECTSQSIHVHDVKTFITINLRFPLNMIQINE